MFDTATTVQFPGLGWSFEIERVAFSIGGIEIYWYAVFICTGLILAVLFAFFKAKKVGIDPDRMIDVIMIGLVCAIIGGRLYYILFDVNGTYNTFFDIINIRAGGIGIYGAIIAAFIAAWFACKWRKVPVLPLFDLAGIGFLIGQAFGRWGNFTNQEAFGTNTTLPWGMYSLSTARYLAAYQANGGTIPVNPNLPVHPTFFYESLWCVVGFILLALYFNRRKFNGEIFLMYIVWYGAGRFFIEGMRTDSLYIGALRISQVVALVSVVGGIILWVIARKKYKGKELIVPEIPPRTAKVRVEGHSEAVVVSWSIDDRTPTKFELNEMAQKILDGTADIPEEGDVQAGEIEAEPAVLDEIAEMQKDADIKDVAESNTAEEGKAKKTVFKRGG